MGTCRTAILTSSSAKHAKYLLPEVRGIVKESSELIGEMGLDDPLPEGTDLLVVLGGDGTLIATIRRTLGSGVPVLGVNAGRLGVLAEFSVDSLREHASEVFGPQPVVREHFVLNVLVFGKDGAQRLESVAVNDCVVTAGPPFRMIELGLKIDNTNGPSLNGDGVIIATPIGSTAYNVSAGGPIVQPTVDAMVITPVAPHSLACRPIVADATTLIEVGITRANIGTSLVLDGQVNHALEEGEKILVRGHDQRAQLVGNPGSPYWTTLIEKMRWAAPPTYRDRGP
jgi:NAD+ kinase